MTFAAFLGLGFALPFLPLFVQELGVSDRLDAAQWAGVLIGLGPLLAGFLAPFWGGLADRLGYRKVAVLALTAIALGQVVAALARNPIHLLASRILSGLFGGIGPLGLAMASSHDPEQKGGAGSIGKIQAAQILAAGFGPLLGGALASFVGIRAAFWGATIACIVAASVVFAFYVDPPRGERAAAGAKAVRPRGESGLFFGALVAVVFLVNFASRSFTPILPAQLASFGVPPTSVAMSVGILISAYSLSAAVSSFVFGRAATTSDPLRLLRFSLVLSLIVAAWMAYLTTFIAFLGVALVFGAVSGGSLTLGYSIGSRRFAEEARGASFGKLSGAALIGGAVSPALAAFIARLGLEGVYWMNAGIYALVLVVSLALRDRR